MKALKKPLSLLMALLMCFGVFAGTGVTAFAAGETMTTYMVDIPRASDPNKAGWGHPALNFLGGWSTQGNDNFTVHTQDSFTGKAIYCIEPGIGVESGDQYTGRGEDFWDNYPSNLNPTIPPSTIKEYIGRVMTYGWQGNADTSWNSNNPDDANEMAGYIATQLLVWETVVGERDSQFNHVDANAQGKNNVAEYISASHPLRSQIFSQYSAIESAVKRHTMLPSFFSGSPDAGAYELKWDGEKYSVTLTDTNNVLGDYTFTSSTTGLNFSVDGNQLTITSNQAIKGSVTVKAEKITAQRSGVVVWTDGVTGGGTQDFATYGATVSDQMVGYLNLEVKTGNMKLIKTSEDGKVEGISFTITGEEYSATKTTNSAGEIDITDLNPGVYTVTEQSIDKYEPQATQRVTIVSGQTATVNFNNVLKRGSLEVTKTSEDGLVEGMTFHLYGTSLSGLPVDEYAVTDSSGVARFENVLIGSDFVLEEVDTPIRYVVPEAQSATIAWNEVTHKSVNNVLKKFRVTVTKSDVETGAPQGDGSLAGATYGLYKGDTLIDSYTTDENGQFTTDTHIHPDHIDMEMDGTVGNMLNKETPVLVQNDEDAQVFVRSGFKDVRILPQSGLSIGEITVTNVPARHGVTIPCGSAIGFMMEGEEKTLYLAGDTVWYEQVEENLRRFQPDVIILNACAAELVDFGRLIMDAKDVEQVITHAPEADVIISHMDNVAHASLSRTSLSEQLESQNLLSRVKIPADGETLSF